MDFGIQREFWNQSPIDTERQRYNAEGLVAQLNCDIYYKKKGRSKRYSQCPSFILKKKCCLGLYPFLHNEPLKPVTAFSLLTGPYGRWSHGLSHYLLLVFWVPSWPAGLSHQHHCRSNITRDFLAYYSGIMLVKHDVFNFLRVSTTFSLKERKQSRLEI